MLKPTEAAAPVTIGVEEVELLPTPPAEAVGRGAPLVTRPVAADEPPVAEAVARPADRVAQYARVRALSSPVQVARSQLQSSSLLPPATHAFQVDWQSSEDPEAVAAAVAVAVAEATALELDRAAQ